MFKCKPQPKGRAIPTELLNMINSYAQDEQRMKIKSSGLYICDSPSRELVFKLILVISDDSVRAKLANLFWKYEQTIDDNLRYVNESKSAFYERMGYDG